MKRVLLKLSGEALAGSRKTGFDEETVAGIARQVKTLHDEGIQIGIVTGGGNFWRGRSSEHMDRTKALYVSEIFRSEGLQTHVMTPFQVGAFTELFSKDAAVSALEKGEIVFFAGGIGHPYFSTDTGTLLRAIEIEADMILLAKSVDGVYDSDPKKNPEARKYREISIDEVIRKDLGVVDMTASILARENHMPMLVFGLNEEESILKAARGQSDGTYVTV